MGAQQPEIHRALLDGGFDLGLVNHLDDEHEAFVHRAAQLGGTVTGR